MEAAMANALTRQPRFINYPDFETKDDFPLWLSGYWAKIRHGYGYKLTEDDKVKKEVVRSISGKLSVGGALDAYNRLTDAERADYDLLIKCLTEEFTDNQEKRIFNETMSYNKRKKDQKLKEFMQEIKKDVNRYSGLPEKITQGGAQVANPEVERQGVRRFCAGIRNKKGKKDKDLSRHLLFHLMDDADLTWENAIKIASRWEMAAGIMDSEEEVEEEDENGEEEEEAEKSGSVAIKEGAINEKDKKICIATLADQVQENQLKIKEMEMAQARTEAKLDEVIRGIQNLTSKMDDLLA